MANSQELKRLSEDLGPYYNQPLLARRREPISLDLRSDSQSKRPSSPGHTPSAKRQSRPSGSRDSSTPKRSPASSATPRHTPTSHQEIRPGPSRGMSQRNRSGRGSNRNNGNSHGEEAQIWEQVKGGIPSLVANINADNESLGKLVDLDKQVGAMDPDKIPGDTIQQMEQLCRSGVKVSEANMQAIAETLEQLKVLRAVVVAKEQADAQSSGPSKRAARDSAATASSLYDFDGAGDSPVPSPIGGSSRKYGDRSSNRDRDSVPPKADSVEPQGSSGSGVAGSASAAANARSKVVFSKGDSVAFRPRPVNGEQTPDWILGEVAQVLGEGKSRRYKVLDIEPEDQSKSKEYRSSASSMIPIAPESQASSLKDWEAGKMCLALYPNTTTFYKAEVHSMASDGKVNLKFEGENDSTTLQQVERRFVIEFRG